MVWTTFGHCTTEKQLVHHLIASLFVAWKPHSTVALLHPEQLTNKLSPVSSQMLKDSL